MCNNTGNQFLIVTSRPYQAGTNNPVTLYVPTMYEGRISSQNTCNCCHHAQTYQPRTEMDDTAYNIALVGNATKGVFEGIAEVIRACKSTPSSSAAASNAGAASDTPKTDTPKTDTPKTDKPVDNSKNTKPDVINTSDLQSDFSKKWSKIGDNYKNVDKQCTDYKNAVTDGDTEKKEKIGADLSKVQTNVNKDIETLKKEIEKGELDDSDKTIAEKALKTLEGIKTKVDNALKTQAPKAAEEPKETEETDKSKETDKVEDKKTGSAKDLDALRAEAKRLNEIFKQKKALQDENPSVGLYALNALSAQYDAITAYNTWAEAVADPANNASAAQISDCKKSLAYITAEGHNISEKVAPLVETSSNLLSKINKM